MAHHNSTPKTVLDAPTCTVLVISEQRHVNRFARRHFYEKPNNALRTIPKAARLQALNEPYRKPVSA